jgi:hypothetical protein
MKIMKIILSTIVVLISAINHLPSSKFLFSGISSPSMMDIVCTNIFFSLLLTFFLIIEIFTISKKKIKIITLLISLMLWGINGRTIGVMTFPEGKIHTGWFHIVTGHNKICYADCETTIIKHSKVKLLCFWRINIVVNNKNNIIFVGPFIWEKTKNMLEMNNFKLPESRIPT